MTWPNLWTQYRAACGPDSESALGLQTNAADIFAFGRMLQLDVLWILVSQFVKAHSLKGIPAHELAPWKVAKAIPEDKIQNYLEQLDVKCPGQIFCVSKDETHCFKGFFFPPREVVYKNTLAVISQLEASQIPGLDAFECRKLCGIAELAMQLQRPTRAAICEVLGYSPERENEGDLLFGEVKRRLQRIQNKSEADRRSGALACSCRKGLSFDNADLPAESAKSQKQQKRDVL